MLPPKSISLPIIWCVPNVASALNSPAQPLYGTCAVPPAMATCVATRFGVVPLIVSAGAMVFFSALIVTTSALGYW